MNLRDRLRDIKEQAPSWAVSLAAHVLILLAAGMVTWVIVRARPPEQTLLLHQPPAGTEQAAQDAGAPAGGAAAQSEAPPAPASPAAALPAAPAPADLERALLAPPVPRGGEFLAATADPSADLARALAADPGAVAAPAGGVGMGLLDGTSGGFGQYIGSLRGTGLDIVLVLDATDSMTPYIEQAKQRLRQVLDVVTGLVPGARIGMVAYKDYGDDYGPDAVRRLPLGDDAALVRKFIDATVAGGGADIPEPVHEALRVAANAEIMDWKRRRRRVIILVGDSPCHSTGRQAAMATAAAFARAGGTISVIDTGGTGTSAAARTTLQPDLAQVAAQGGGEAFLLKDTDAFWRYLIVSVFGQRFEQDVGVIIKKLIRED
jgi:hypothetical protein